MWRKKELLSRDTAPLNFGLKQNLLNVGFFLNVGLNFLNFGFKKNVGLNFLTFF